ncbi:MAG: 2-oxo acid dehydrogenase subunit E2 [Caldilineaceae bacterium]|nr:2-oxo acid dehydrogenase subunit E2 [Caldilineaceae bacterium]MBP8106463.1 2-oxo acid dehydrogenase subunit E2 [Caldilineaceae bacterium]MBP8122676.1 2-oxo acid dehydrogenase subunit E2 [Caldilineaceae bacterium]MBP9072008.1 2-oxo acid dehydrogenase subunit E2 [Caldilineaceae bacterium]
MSTPIILPRLGNSVESCILLEWKVAVGDTVAENDVIAEVETDKAVMEVASSAAGTILALRFAAGDDVPVMAEMAVVGEPNGEWQMAKLEDAMVDDASGKSDELSQAQSPVFESQPVEPPLAIRHSPFASPRARHLAERKSLDITDVAGSGPGGRVIERDVEAALAARPKISPVAQAKLADGDFTAPTRGSGPGGRIMAEDLVARGEKGRQGEAERGSSGAVESSTPLATRPSQLVPLRGIRKVIAERMLASVQTTAQLTLNASADARALKALRARLKASPEALGLQRVTINDLVLFATARTLADYPEINALFLVDAVERHSAVHLGVAVDTPRGLMVPVIPNADQLSLKAISVETKRVADGCLNNKITPDELSGGTFTVTNLGAFGIENFTPVLNLPQVAILGVGNIQLKPVEDKAGAVAFVPHIGLSLTINHQVVDGAPAARFLQSLSQNLANIDLLMAI